MSGDLLGLLSGSVTERGGKDDLFKRLGYVSCT